MISIADGRIPAATIRETASPASSIERNAASCVTTASGCRTIRRVTSTAIPSVPSEPTTTPSRSGPSSPSIALPPSSSSSPSGQHDLRAGDVVDREAVLEAVRAARVLRDVAADRADLLARRVGGVEVAVGGDGARHVEVRDARLDDDALALEVDLEDPAHPGDGDDDPVRDGERAAGEAGAGAARDERDPVARAEPEHGLHLVRRAREHDARGLRAPAGEAVAVVGREPSGAVSTYSSPTAAREVLDESRRKRHRRDPTSDAGRKHR